MENSQIHCSPHIHCMYHTPHHMVFFAIVYEHTLLHGRVLFLEYGLARIEVIGLYPARTVEIMRSLLFGLRMIIACRDGMLPDVALYICCIQTSQQLQVVLRCTLSPFDLLTSSFLLNNGRTSRG